MPDTPSRPSNPKVFTATALVVFGIMFVAGMIAVSVSTSANLPTIATVVIFGLGTGFMKLVNVIQNTNTNKAVEELDVKVEEDVKVNKETKQLVNGGLDERIAQGVERALAKIEADKAAKAANPKVQT